MSNTDIGAIREKALQRMRDQWRQAPTAPEAETPTGAERTDAVHPQSSDMSGRSARVAAQSLATFRAAKGYNP